MPFSSFCSCTGSLCPGALSSSRARATNRGIGWRGGTRTAQGHTSIAVSTRHDWRSIATSRHDGRCIAANLFSKIRRNGLVFAVAFPTVVEFGTAGPTVHHALAARRRHAVATDKCRRKIGARLFRSKVGSRVGALKGAASVFVQCLLAVSSRVVSLQRQRGCSRQ